MATFEFNQQLVPQSLINIEEIGEFAIEASNDEGYYYYLIVKTLLGTCTMASCGPVIPDVPLLTSGFKISLDKCQYKEDKVAKSINFWLNDKSKKLTSAQIISIDEALYQFPDVANYMRNLSEETL